jgi:hypothetical protein
VLLPATGYPRSPMTGSMTRFLRSAMTANTAAPLPSPWGQPRRLRPFESQMAGETGHMNVKMAEGARTSPALRVGFSRCYREAASLSVRPFAR